jgi:hypothetical protein
MRLAKTMTDTPKAWDAAIVRTWLDRRAAASKLDQATADRAGYEARDEYDQAAAEEWVCRALREGDWSSDQTRFAARLKTLIAQDGYPAAGINDDIRFERHVRGHLRRIAKMTKTNTGFENTFRFR